MFVIKISVIKEYRVPLKLSSERELQWPKVVTTLEQQYSELEYMVHVWYS